MKKAEVKQLEEDLAYWQHLGDLLGWQVYGFTGRFHASYATGDARWHTIQLGAHDRDDIVNAIESRVLIEPNPDNGPDFERVYE